MMGFTYQGVEYQIFVDVGEHDEAYRLAADEDCEALSKWPKYSESMNRAVLRQKVTDEILAGQKHDYTEYNRVHGTSYGEQT